MGYLWHRVISPYAQTSDGDRDDDERADREDQVIGKRGAQTRVLVLRPSRKHNIRTCKGSVMARD